MKRVSRKLFQTILLILPQSVLAGPLVTSQPAAERPYVELTTSQGVPGIGAGQGVSLRDGFIYIYGDFQTGVIREYRLAPEGRDELAWTNREFLLTREGRDLVPHPTGLAFQEKLPTFLGNTVGGKGTIFGIDWERLTKDGNLDHAVLATVEDDLAANGTRPEYVFRAGRWVIATADYGDQRNEIRYYDPQRLARAQRTSDPGVLLAKQPCGAWVQGLSWMAEKRMLVLIQNQTQGRGWRLTWLPSIEAGAVGAPIVQDFPVRGELEGFAPLERNRCLFVQGSRRENIWFGRLRRSTTAPASVPAGD